MFLAVGETHGASCEKYGSQLEINNNLYVAIYYSAKDEFVQEDAEIIFCRAGTQFYWRLHIGEPGSRASRPPKKSLTRSRGDAEDVRREWKAAGEPGCVSSRENIEANEKISECESTALAFVLDGLPSRS